MQGIMDAQHERQQVAALADVRYRPGQPGTASIERVFGRGKPYPEGALAGPPAFVGSGEV